MKLFLKLIIPSMALLLWTSCTSAQSPPSQDAQTATGDTLLPAFEKDATLQFARLHSTEKYYKQGLVSEEQLSRLKLSLKFEILELAQ